MSRKKKRNLSVSTARIVWLTEFKMVDSDNKPFFRAWNIKISMIINVLYIINKLKQSALCGPRKPTRESTSKVSLKWVPGSGECVSTCEPHSQYDTDRSHLSLRREHGDSLH